MIYTKKAAKRIRSERRKAELEGMRLMGMMQGIMASDGEYQKYLRQQRRKALIISIPLVVFYAIKFLIFRPFRRIVERFTRNDRA